VGVFNTTGGNIMISGYGTGQVSVFGDTNGQNWSAGTQAVTNYGANNATGIATLNGNFYMALQSSGQVQQITAAGNSLITIANIPIATGIVGDTATNRLYVSSPGGSIYA